MPVLKRILPLFWAALTVGIVGGVVWVGLRHVQTPATSVDARDATPATGPAFLRNGHDYYVLVKLVEFDARKSNGSYWDRGTNTAPDGKVLLFWRGQEIFALPTRENQFICTWDLFRVNVVDIVRNGGSVDIASAINAPLVRVADGETLVIEARDADVLSDDVAMRVEFPLAEMREGENDIAPPRGSSVRRLIVHVIDRETSLSELIELAGKR